MSFSMIAFRRTLLSAGAAAGLALALIGCNSTSSTTTTSTDQSSPTPGASAMAGGTMGGSMSGSTDRYGGPSYKGAPNLAATAALVKAGGGATHFSTATALTSMVGSATVGKEVAKLDKQYGKTAVTQFLKTFDFAVDDALKIATADGITLPAPAPLTGKALAVALVKMGTTRHGTFWTGWMLDHAVSNKIHNQVMDDIDAKYGQAADAKYHTISNQAFYDLGQALGDTSLKLAKNH